MFWVPGVGIAGGGRERPIPKKTAIFWNRNYYRTATLNTNGFPDISFQNFAVIISKFRRKFGKEISPKFRAEILERTFLTDILDEGECVSSQPRSARTFRADLHTSVNKEEDKTNRTGPDNPTSKVQVENIYR